MRVGTCDNTTVRNSANCVGTAVVANLLNMHERE